MSGVPNNNTRASRRRAELEQRRLEQQRSKQRAADASAAETALRTSAPSSLGRYTAAAAAVIMILAVGVLGIISPYLPIAGDQVTHNWWLTEFRDRLFRGDIFGWTNDLSAGYLFGFFYFPTPAIIFAVLGLVLPDAVAIKCMVAGSLALIPFGAWRLAKGLGLPPATAALAPLASLALLFSNQPSFVGGTLYSTLTGEFSYAYGLAFSMIAIGEVLRTARGEGRWWVSALALAAAVTSHLLAAIPAAIVVAVVLVKHFSTEARRNLVSMLVLAVAASCWWTVPSIMESSEALGDGHRRVTDFLGWIAPLYSLPLVLSGIAGLVFGVVKRRPGARVLVALAASGPAFLLAMPGSFMWNVRVMPWYFAALSISLIYLAEPVLAKLSLRKKAVQAFVVVFGLASLLLSLSLPANFQLANMIRESQYGGKNLSGTKYIDELTELLGTLPPGRAMVAMPEKWIGALPARDWVTALPMHTDGRITSPITLYYEASRSTPGIEYTHSYVSYEAHTSLSWMRYRTPDEGFDIGVRSLQLHGIRYYVVGDQKMFDFATKNEELKLLNVVGQESGVDAHQWAVFEVRNADVITPVRTPIEVVPALPSERAWGSAAANWIDVYDENGEYPLPLESGPAEFDGTRTYEDAVVSDVLITDERISFTTSRIGVPILVKVSHSGHWRATGATGPYRSAPNFMLVVPTDARVELRFTAPLGERIGPPLALALGLGLFSYRLRLRRKTGS